MTTALPPICLWCVHHHGQQSSTTCDAFPEGIPEEVMSGSASHMEPIPGDSGITFEMMPGKDFPMGLYPERSRVKERTALASDPPAGSPLTKSDPPSPAEAPPRGRIVWRSLSDEEADALLAEAERRGKEDPGSITVLVPSKKV